jgi:peroxiredoxin|uniref:peroxiredoxin family protein n=1 Tax=Prosthecobacter sp. TaxID=1965333 RepID=UPI0037834B75
MNSFGQAVDASNLDKDVKSTTLHSVGDAAPDFSCRTTDSREFKLSAQMGRVVLLYFFSSSNPACFAQMKYLENEVFQKLRRRDDFQMIALGRGHAREELVQIGGEHRLTFPLAADPKQEIYTRYFSKYVPRIVVLRWDGSIAYQASGADYEGVLRLQEVLARELAAARTR